MLRLDDFQWPWLTGYRTKGLWWFRVKGYGLHWKRIADHPLLFSQRYGLTGIRVGGWFFSYLRPKLY